MATTAAELDGQDSSSFDWSFYIYVLLSVGALIAVIILIFITLFGMRNRKRRRQTNTLQEGRRLLTTLTRLLLE